MIGGGLAAWVMMTGERGETSEKGRPSKIAEVVPKKGREAPKDSQKPKEAQMTNAAGEAVAPVAVSEPHAGRPATPTVITSYVEVAKSRFDIFRHPSEMELCSLANTPAGDMVIGAFEYDEEFMKDLQQAMVDRIETSPDDPEDIRRYKESVIAMKKQIAQMLKDGEDVAKALADTREELQELGVYKHEIELAVDELRDKTEEWTDDEVDAFVKKANELLKEKGAEPFEFNKLTREIIKRNPFASPEEKEAEEAAIEEANEAALAAREAEQISNQGEENE